MSGLICNEDYLDDALERYASSEDPQFPESNLYDKGLRGRVYRSAGTFLIDSTNNQIVLAEGPSYTPVTATIVEGLYSSLTAFYAAVSYALSAVGSDPYVVSRLESNLKVKIQRLGVGDFRLLWTDPNSTAYDVLGFSNLADDDSAFSDIAGYYYLSDSIRNHTYERIIWDLGASSNPDVFILIGKKSQAIKISENAEIRLQGSTTLNFDSGEYDEVLDYNEVAIMKLKTEGADGLHTSALRYWSLKIIDRENANGCIEISKVYLGEYYETDRARIQFPFNITSEDFSQTTQLQYGGKTSNIKERTENFVFNWFPLTVTEKEMFDEIYRIFGTSVPFFMIFDTDNCIGSSTNYSTRYVKFKSDPNLSLERPGIWDASWTLEEQI